MLSFRQTDREAIAKDALSSEGKSPQERLEMFSDLMATVNAIVEALPPEERRRRFWIAQQLDPRPVPWWKNFRAEVVAEYQCPISSS